MVSGFQTSPILQRQRQMMSMEWLQHVVRGSLTVRFLVQCLIVVILLQIVLLFKTPLTLVRPDAARRSILTGLVNVTYRAEIQRSISTRVVNGTHWAEHQGSRSLALLHYPHFFFKPFFDPLVRGKQRQKQGFLTIGIPTVRRPNTNQIYIYETLDSIITNTNEKERRDDVTVVVLLSDVNATYNDVLTRNLLSKYKQHFEDGFLRLIRPHSRIYPDLSNVKRTFKDSPERLKWRAKQNIDFAYLMLYSKNISQYYIQLEDDVIAASKFVSDIKQFIINVTEKWFLLEFSRLGFIGKLFRSQDLSVTASFLLRSFEEYPGDLLLGQMRVRQGQRKPIHCNASLFQHVGKFSSLKDKFMPSIDKTFKDRERLHLSIHDITRGDNPPADIATNIRSYLNYVPQNSYDGNSSTFFWGKTPWANSYLGLTFKQPYNFSRIIITTGSLKTVDDSLADFGQLMVASVYNLSMFREPKAITSCGPFVMLTRFVGGQVDTKATGEHIPNNIVCIQIHVKKRMKTWLIVRDIELFL